MFCRVVQLGGIGRAADDLGVSQPVVTTHIRSLERQLAIDLFDRSRARRDELTEAGEVVYRWAEDVLRRTRQVERDLLAVHDGVPGCVAVGASTTLGTYELIDLVNDFRRDHPGVALRLDVADTDRTVAAVRDGRLDFALVEFPDVRAVPVDMQVELLDREELTLVAAPSLTSGDGALDVQELARLPLIEATSAPGEADHLDDELRRAGVYERCVVLRLGHPEAIKRAAVAGFGAAFLTRGAVAGELDDGTLCEITVEGFELRMPIALVHYRDRVFSGPQNDLLQAIRRSRGGTLLTDQPVRIATPA